MTTHCQKGTKIFAAETESLARIRKVLYLYPMIWKTYLSALSTQITICENELTHLAL